MEENEIIRDCTRFYSVVRKLDNTIDWENVLECISGLVLNETNIDLVCGGYRDL